MAEPIENRIPKDQKPVKKKHEIPDLEIEIKVKPKPEKPPEQNYNLN